METVSAHGLSGQVTVDDSFVTITRRGMRAKLNLGMASAGDKRIPISSIAAVTLKKPGISDGAIRFTIQGSREGAQGLQMGWQDGNTVTFSRKQLLDFEAVRERVETLLPGES